MKLGCVVHYVPDVEAAAAFYEQAFGLHVRYIDHSGHHAQMDTGGTPLCFIAEGPRAEAGHTFRAHRPFERPAATEVGFLANDVPAACEAALKAGAVPYEPPKTRPNGQVVACVRDLNGVLVEICSEVGEQADEAWRFALRG